MISKLTNIVFRVAACIILAVLSPLIWLIIIMTYSRLRRIAHEIEPPPTESARFYRICREILAIIVLPIIVIVGMFATVIYGVEDEDEVDVQQKSK